MSEKPKQTLREQKGGEAATKPLPSSSVPAFTGFAPPTSNTTYTPNQFFDVCLPHYSRGCVRLVAYMLRRTLGWCDAAGNPQEDQIVISYNDLVSSAGISRGAINDAIEEALSGKFIRCIHKGRPSSPSSPAVSALYELRWSQSQEYLKDPKRFDGFFEGEGNRTDIPNEYFDVVIRTEPLATAKVVGAIIRFSIGFQARRGARRQQAELSFSDIQRYSRIASRQVLSEAIKRALEQNYILRVQAGLFTPDKDQQITTTYAIKWIDRSTYIGTGSKTVPEETMPTGSKTVPEDRFKNRTRSGSKTVPEDRFKNRTSIKTKLTNETLKQQQAAAEPVSLAYQLLKEQGFSAPDAQRLADGYPEATIVSQIAWLPLRNPSRNRLGMLRKAIEEAWPQPEQCPSSDIEFGKAFAAHFYAGYAGNEHEPVTTPTLGDAQDAQAFVERLLALWPAEERVPEWGRALGKLYAQQPSKATLVSCRVGLRTCGDEFYTRIRNERESLRKKQLQEVRENHKRQHAGSYRQYLLSEEQRIRTSDAHKYQEFEMARAAERERIASSPFAFSEEFRAEQLKSFDETRQRLRDLAEFFSLPSFWQWDRQLNPEPFDERSQTLCV